jgi:mannose-1-phosphate guanylyltransferase
MEQAHSAHFRGFGWSDIGTWDAVWDVPTKSENGNATESHVERLEARVCVNSFIRTGILVD